MQDIFNKPDVNEYRCYFMTNMYLSQIQRGIQSAHVVHELFLNYADRDLPASRVLWDWAQNHKTVIVLNGGYQSILEETYSEIAEIAGLLKLPFAKFREEEDSLNNALTAIGVVVPSSIYKCAMPTGNVFFERDNPSKLSKDRLGQVVGIPEYMNADVLSWSIISEQDLAVYHMRMLLDRFTLA